MPIPHPVERMNDITREQLFAFLDDSLDETDSARIERALRDSEELRGRLEQAMRERDLGDHSIGAVWRRRRLSCPSREQLGSHLLGVLDEGDSTYIKFHLDTIECPFCLANLADLQEQQQAAEEPKKRRKRFFQSSAEYLGKDRKTN